MSENAPKQVPAQEILQQRIEASADRMLRDAKQEGINENSIEDVRAYLLKRFEERARPIFIERADEFENFMQELKSFPAADSKTLATALSKKISKFLLSDHQPEELETLLRQENAAQEKWIEVNAAVSYEVSEGQIKLHVPMMFTGQKPAEMLRLFEQGLRTIASRLAEDPALSDVKKVTGYSWIVYKHPAIVERMGFTVTKRNDDTQEAVASITREEFLKHFGS